MPSSSTPSSYAHSPGFFTVSTRPSGHWRSTRSSTGSFTGSPVFSPLDSAAAVFCAFASEAPATNPLPIPIKATHAHNPHNRRPIRFLRKMSISIAHHLVPRTQLLDSLQRPLAELMQIVQTVFGVFHHFELARELDKRGHLQRVYSTWPWARLKREGLPREKGETL